jgi:hypothetical protein
LQVSHASAQKMYSVELFDTKGALRVRELLR